MDSDVPRRRLFGWAGAAGVGGLAAGALGERYVRDGQTDDTASAPGSDETDRLAAAEDPADTRPGGLPQGLTERVPAFGRVLAVDLADDVRRSPGQSRRTAADLLAGWAQVAVTSDGSAGDSVERDMRPASLEVAYGIGASLLRSCGLDEKRPEAMVDLPSFPTDDLERDRSGGDLVIQIASEDPMRIAAAVQNVVSSLGVGARVRWARGGFRQTLAATRDPQQTARNLMGHRDGTNNPERGSPLWETVVRAREPAGPTDWMNGGSYLVVRDIRIDLNRWFAEPTGQRDAVIGRHTQTGAPLGTRSEHADVELGRRDSTGRLVIPPHAHIRLASSTNTAGSRIYRRSWNYDDGWNSDGTRDAGLLFLAWQADPRRGFIPIQQSLSNGHDDLNEYTNHIGSALFAMLPQAERGQIPGARLFNL